MISIITATYNAENCLTGLLDSILSQSCLQYEIIIIDGGSKDATLDIIRAYQTHISYWISEQDKGIYDAWNKGIDRAKGEWLMFLGADDTLQPDAIQNYADFLSQRADADELLLVSSKREMFDVNGKSIRITGYKWEWPLFLEFMTITHPGALHSKKLFKQYGNYDTSYKISGDYELLLRPQKNLKAAFMDRITVKMSEGGASDSLRAIKEYYRAVTQTGGNSKIVTFINSAIAIAKFVVKKTARKLGFNIYLMKE